MQEQILLRIPGLTGDEQAVEKKGEAVLFENKKETVLPPATETVPPAPAIDSLRKNEQTPSVPSARREEADAPREMARVDGENIAVLLPETTQLPLVIEEETPVSLADGESLSEVAEPPVESLVDSENTLSPRDNRVEFRPLLPPEPLVIRFKYDSNEFSREDIEKMKEFAGLVKLNPAVTINVFGYTDAIGDAAYNLKLSEFRANIVKSFLLGQNIPPEQIRAQGLGDKNPIATNGTAEGRNMNRRVEISVDENM
jgi:outer membrane protein OmpA-like peptidoglycan-associated protein